MSDIGLSPAGRLRTDVPRRSAAALQALSSVSSWLPDASIGFGLAILWAFAHAFVGIEGDANIYMGRALADLDPTGLGRDLMFANDGQASFSLFRVVATDLVGTIGLGPTVAVLTTVNLVAWFVAVVTFVRSFVEGRALVLVLAAVCVLPRVYAPWHFLAAGESLPLPRPFAEACVLVALAAVCRERYVLAATSLAIGALFHPIIAASGVGVLLVMLGLRDWRWFAGAALLGATLLVAGFCGLPVASRFFVTIDPIWRGILLERNPYLFPHLWPIDSFARYVVQAATIFVGGAFVEVRIRRLLYVAIAIGILGCASSFLFGDYLGSLLVLQAQLWRAFWLPAVLAPIAAGLCLWHLPNRGAVGQVTLAALCAAWLTIDDFPVGPIAALAAVGIQFGAIRLPLKIGRPTIVAAWASVIVLGLISEYSSLQVLHTMLARLPAGEPSGWTFAFLVGLPAIPVLLFAAIWRAVPQSAVVRIGASVLVAVCTCVLVSTWDVRTPARRDLDSGHAKSDLVALLDTRPGAVLWLDGTEVWFWARRGNWAELTQGGSMIFSRDLAAKWRYRVQVMREHGLATDFTLDPWKNPASLDPRPLVPTAVSDFCRRPDAPAWIVSALEPGSTPPETLGAAIWTSRLAGWRRIVGRDDVKWANRDRFAVIACGAGTS